MTGLEIFIAISTFLHIVCCVVLHNLAREHNKNMHVIIDTFDEHESKIERLLKKDNFKVYEYGELQK